METEKTKKSIPKILVLKPFTPSGDSVRADRLQYNNLEPHIKQQRPHEYYRLNQVFEAEADSVKEEKEARKLAMLYLLMGSAALQRAESKKSIELWSDRFTESSGELYGMPEPEVAMEVEAEQVAGMESVEKFKEVAEKLRTYIEDKYHAAFAALNLEDAPEDITPEYVADKFEAAMAVLAANFDEAWGEWKVNRDETKDSISVEQQTKTVIVGMKRANMTPQQLKGLFAHEILVHAQRSINGAKKSDMLRSGLAGYLDAEEGFGTLVEYAFSGELKDVVLDRYVDIAWALGQIDGVKHTREEMLVRVRERAEKRLLRRGKSKNPEDLEKEIYAHVNRIYRGSRGDETVGVFTKDIAYYKGFLDIGRYIEDRLEVGDDIDTIFEYLIQGKFDPSNTTHVEYIESLDEKKQ